MTFNEKYNYKSNSFDIIRLILAIIVIYGHTYPVLYGTGMKSPSGQYDIVAMFTKNQIGSGTIAVYMFFVISGFLITQSIINSKSIHDYILKRVLRIIPALFCSLLLSVLVIGLIATQNITDYLNSKDPILYFLSNITFGFFGFYYSLVDVFNSNPFPSSINASMWTLPHEFACYLLVIVFSIFNFFNKRERIAFAYIISLILVYYNIRFGFVPINLDNNYWILGTNNINSFVNVSYYFFAGSLIYCYKDKLKYSRNLFIIFIICVLIAARLGSLKYCLLVCLPFITMYLSMKKPCINLKRIGDFSYGMYIYAFPIQQFLVYILKDSLTFVAFFLISFICILCISMVSWFIIEKPALNLKLKLIK